MKLFIILCFTLSLLGQKPFLWIKNTTSSTDTLTLEIMLSNVVEISSVQFSLKWDNEHINYHDAIYNNQVLVSGSNVNLQNTNSGILAFSWYENSGNTISRNDSLQLIVLKFLILKNAHSNIYFLDKPTKIEVSQNFTKSSSITKNFMFSTTTRNTKSPKLIFENKTIKESSDLVFRSKNFSSVSSFQLSFKSPSTDFRFVSFYSKHFPGSQDEYITLTDSVISILWYSKDGNLLEISDDTEFFKISMEYTGEDSLVFLNPTINEIVPIELSLNYISKEFSFSELSTPTHDSFIPAQFLLKQNYPNPFNPKTTISYRLNQASRVSLIVYNIMGQKIKTLVNNFQNSGINYDVVWDGKNENKQNVSSGVYFYILKSENYSDTKKMILLK
jgi:hypothetical protein